MAAVVAVTGREGGDSDREVEESDYSAANSGDGAPLVTQAADNSPASARSGNSTASHVDASDNTGNRNAGDSSSEGGSDVVGDSVDTGESDRPSAPAPAPPTVPEQHTPITGPRVVVEAARPPSHVVVGTAPSQPLPRATTTSTRPPTMQNFDEVTRPTYRRKADKFPIKTVTAAIFLFTLGTIFLIWGVKTLQTDRDRGIAMIVIGAMTFIPGSYASYNLYGAYRRWPGFKYAHVPSYDE